MPGFQVPISIFDVIRKIDNHEYLLPAIQREFVWSHEKIEWLFDSLMRKYPISSFLFWSVSGKTISHYKYYKFISEFREKYKTHNDEICTDGFTSFSAVLDGQQRLTSLYIGLKGSFAYRTPRLWDENTERVYPTRHLYLNIENELNDQEDGRIYEFKFIEQSKTNRSMLYDSKWFRVGAILDYADNEKFDNYVEGFTSAFSRRTLRALRRTVHEEKVINYYLEDTEDIDKALNIFIRINSGGESLNFSDLIMSIAVAHWEQKDARKEIHSLVDSVRDKGFIISKDFILKTYLYLYSKDIKFRIANFSSDNAKDFEKHWESIRDVILTVFDLLKIYGYTEYTLTSKNALIPIIYYIYHRAIFNQFEIKSCYKEDRELIKRWLHIALLKRVFGSHSDTILSKVRRVFTDDVESNPTKNISNSFPIDKLNNDLKADFSVGDEFIKELLYTQKDDKYSFSILALLYPHLDYKNNNFHKDHLHPASKFNTLSQDLKDSYGWNVYNSVLNLQMLDANENMAKQDKDLSDWVTSQTDPSNKSVFLDRHLIPDVSLDLSNFKEFIEKRMVSLEAKLKSLL